MIKILKTPRKIKIVENFLIFIQRVYEIHTANITLNGKRLNAFFPR